MSVVDEICEDDSTFAFKVYSKDGIKIDVGCEWLTKDGINSTQIVNRFTKWCNASTSDISNYCPKACAICSDTEITQMTSIAIRMQPAYVKIVVAAVSFLFFVAF